MAMLACHSHSLSVDFEDLADEAPAGSKLAEVVIDGAQGVEGEAGRVDRHQ